MPSTKVKPSTPWLHTNKDGDGDYFGDDDFSVCFDAIKTMFSLPENVKAIRLVLVDKPTRFATTVVVNTCSCGCQSLLLNGHYSYDIQTRLYKHFTNGVPNRLHVECEYR